MSRTKTGAPSYRAFCDRVGKQEPSKPSFRRSKQEEGYLPRSYCRFLKKNENICAMEMFEPGLSNSELAVRVSKLWPHREHEANGALGLVCIAGADWTSHPWCRTRTSPIASGAQK